MQILNLLAVVARIESEMAGLYEWMSRVFDNDEGAAGLFFRLSMQEKSHYNMVTFGKRLVHTSPNEFARVEVNRDDIEGLLSCIAEFQKLRPQPSLEQALVFAMKAEQHLGENIHRAAIIDSNPGLADMFHRLAVADEEHFRTLREFATERLGAPPAAGAPDCSKGFDIS